MAVGTGTGRANGHAPFGGFLDAVPAGLYAAAHVLFLAVGLALWWQASAWRLPFSAALLLYAASQLGFLAYFAGAVTMKTAVLVEQTLACALVVLVVLAASPR